MLDDTNFPIKFAPLPFDLFVESINGKEEISGLFVFHMNLVSTEHELMFEDVVGKQVTASLDLPVNGEKRYFNGFITELRFTGTRPAPGFLGASDHLSTYQATVRPWFWFLTQTADCRIFQTQTVPDIIKEVFRLNDMSDFDDRLGGTYREWEYCVQYRETDFNFISRLMEQEGIYYFFEHTENTHTLVLADETSAPENFKDYPEIEFHSSLGGMVHDRDHLDAWTTKQSIMPSKYAIQDFDFKNPKTKLLKKLGQPVKHDNPQRDPEIFDYPGEYVTGDEGETYVEYRLQELNCQHERIQAGGNCRGLAPGCWFTYTNFPREDQNKDYLTISVAHVMNNQTPFLGQSGELYHCEVEVLDKLTPFRAARETPKPIVQGPQTAIVVGPSAEEIYTDEYGRVKVQFHWDRYGNRDENSSCWVRVSQLWAETKWGGIHIPRIGQEVVVSFLEGDPDRPLITGSVYNANTMPPYTLEANKTQSGIKSRSTKGGGPDNFNELRMEDKKGSEELYIQAEKDERILVKNNKTENVGNDETVTIGHNRTETVQLNETLTVANDRTRSVLNNESITVSKFRTHTVGINENINVGVAQEVVVGGLQMIEVGATQSLDVGLSQSVNVGSSQSIDIGKDRSLGVGKDCNVSVGKDRNSDIGEKESIKIGKEWVVEVGDSITIKCGSSQIVMKKNGNIQLKGKDITFKASGKMGLKASSAITLKGSSIKEN